MPWIVELAGWIVTRYGIGRDGKSPLELLTGRRPAQPIYELGECVQFRPCGQVRSRGKLQSQLSSGVYLGSSNRTGEHYCGNENSLHKARDVYCKSPSECFVLEKLQKVQCTPWCPNPKDDDEGVRAVEYQGKASDEAREGDGNEDPAPRSMKITQDMLEEFGSSARCPGCVAVRLGRPPR